MSSDKTVVTQIDQQELQHLITVSTGFIDAYIIECHDRVPMLLPQNIVLSALDTKADAQSIEWHDLKLPVYAVTHPTATEGVALVIEGDDVAQRFALMCNNMPQSIRLRISEVVDEENVESNPMVFKQVKIADQHFHVPNLENIQKSLGIL
ncbi:MULTISPECIES: hypothetical protein [unclassified Acinetobacter]|uniref:hypothetical protein n=1 Tax=unclassified Acinetobacter TaxID=196816 RepID=UPI00190E3CFF|nr:MULTISPECIES: hypothetical protein [unclassified Acinetobacter]MBK0064373.1 hypothetical protein [Acinetobacter sp. S55]MBK0067822.1 hypothetical protein [Acinetobacter sp. S54]